jgi:hypothetical protein|tara:strand:- start:4788 stop:5102 length:315 start_codon:yes stop_codon:yes gene_type:complete
MGKVKSYYHDQICAQDDIDCGVAPDNYAEVVELAKQIGLVSRQDIRVFLGVFHFQDQDLSEVTSDGYEKMMAYSNAFECMPYGTLKARTGDPYEWLADYFEGEL